MMMATWSSVITSCSPGSTRSRGAHLTRRLQVAASGKTSSLVVVACMSDDACTSTSVIAPCHMGPHASRRGARHAPHAQGNVACHGSSKSDVYDTQGRVGVVIVDHGSRKKDSNDMLNHFGLLYQSVTGAHNVEVAHMEIAEPTIEQAIDKCVARGASTVIVAPYFLSRGRHIQEDIPALVKAAQAKHPDVRCVIADPIGIEPLMAQIIHNRVTDALAVQHATAANN